MAIPNINNIGSFVTVTLTKGQPISGKIVENNGGFLTIETDEGKNFCVSTHYIVFYEEYISTSVIEDLPKPDDALDNQWPKPMGFVTFDEKKGKHYLKLYGKDTTYTPLDPKVIIDDFSKGSNLVVVCKDEKDKVIYLRKLGPYQKFLEDAEAEEKTKKAMAIVDMVLSLCPNNGSALLLKRKINEKQKLEQPIIEACETFEMLVKADQYDNALNLFEEKIVHNIPLPFSLLSRLFRQTKDIPHIKTRLFEFFCNNEEKIPFNDFQTWLKLLLKENDFESLSLYCEHFKDSKHILANLQYLSIVYYYLALSAYNNDDVIGALNYAQKSLSFDCNNENTIVFLRDSIRQDEVGLPSQIDTYVSLLLKNNDRIIGVPNNWKSNPANAFQKINRVLTNISMHSCYELDPDIFISYCSLFVENYGSIGTKVLFSMARYFYFKSVHLIIKGVDDYSIVKDYSLASICIFKKLENEIFYEKALLLYMRTLLIEDEDSDITLSDIALDDIKKLSIDNLCSYISQEGVNPVFWINLFGAEPPASLESFSLLNDIYKDATNNDSANILNDWNEYYNSVSEKYEHLIELSNQLTSTDAIPGLVDDLCFCGNDLDQDNIKEINEDIVPLVQAIETSNKLDVAQQNYKNYKKQSVAVYSQLKKARTILSYSCLLPLLNALRSIAKKIYSFIKEQSKPSFNLSVESQSEKNENDEIALQIGINVDNSSSSIYDIVFSINDSEYFTIIDIRNGNCDGLNAGENYIAHATIKLSEKAIQEKALTLSCTCSYSDIDKESSSSIFYLPLSLSQNEMYIPFENKYFRDGGKGLTDEKMFYGREKDIVDVVSTIRNTSSCHFALYGQKRSGKSSFLNMVENKLKSTNDYFIVSFTLTKSDCSPIEYAEYAFYYAILRKFKSSLNEIDGAKPSFDLPSKNEFVKSEDSAKDKFIEYISQFKVKFRSVEGWQNKKIVIMIDEFTVLYPLIKLKQFPNTFFQEWKSIVDRPDSCFSSILCGHDTFPMWLNESPNESRIFIPKRLGYLDIKDAIDLIVNPILDSDNKSRYTGKAVDLILEYTSCNPYYIQYFCKVLVDTIQDNRCNRITEADVYSVAEKLVDGANEFIKSENSFDNLISCGEAKEDKSNTEYKQEFPEADILTLLRAIARHSTLDDKCKKTDLLSLFPIELLDKYLENLKMREVIEINHSDVLGIDIIKIQVKLFTKWLQKN